MYGGLQRGWDDVDIAYDIFSVYKYGTAISIFGFVHRKHKKGQTEEIVKRKTRKTQKFQKAVAGATINEIMAKRNQKPEVRKAQREQAIRYVCCLSQR